MQQWKSYRYKNLTLLLLSVLLTLFLSRNEVFHGFLLRLGEIGYVGAFIGGILFVSTFTVSIGIIILLVLAESLSPIEIGMIAGLGAVIGDLLIFHFIRSQGLIQEIRAIFKHLYSHKISHLFHTKYFSWTLPVLGAIIIASPLPDEIGVSLMGISKLRTYQFLLLSFVLNCIGIALVISASTIIKP